MQKLIQYTRKRKKIDDSECIKGEGGVTVFITYINEESTPELKEGRKTEMNQHRKFLTYNKRSEKKEETSRIKRCWNIS